MLMRRNRRFGVRARSLNTSSPRARLAPSTPAVLQVSPHSLRGDGQAREHGHMDEIEAGSVDRTRLHPRGIHWDVHCEACAPDSLPIVGWLFILANWRTIKLGRKPLMG